jgi:hypothetical protein
VGFFAIGPFKFSRRGVRVSFGPRALRVHGGTYGRPGVSTRIGPVYAYQSLGSFRRPSKADRMKLARSCSYCGAKPNRWCRTRKGARAAKLHSAR